MTTAVTVDIAAMLESAQLPKMDIATFKGMLRDNHFYLTRKQRREIEHKIELREMDGHVFQLTALFGQSGAWRENNKEIEGSLLSRIDRLPAIAFAGVKDERAQYRGSSGAFEAHGEEYHVGNRDFGNSALLKSRVPYIPKRYMPRWGTRGDHYIIFDVPKWQVIPIIVDPYLVRQIDDEHFEVRAHWDLTDNERKLMQFAASKR